MEAIRRIFIFFFCLLLTLLCLVGAADVLQIKKSRSGICHGVNSAYYEQIKHYTAYFSLDECLASGGKVLKRNEQAVQEKIFTPCSVEQINAGKDVEVVKYSRDYFEHWIRKKGCINTRHELLMSQSTAAVETGHNYCTATQGRWLDPYTGKVFYKASELDIDHVVPLRWAWDHGADCWLSDKRKQFANDTANLLAVQASVNRTKGALWPVAWMPPDLKFHCQYVLRFMRIVKKYQLRLSELEQKQLNQLKIKVCHK